MVRAKRKRVHFSAEALIKAVGVKRILETIGSGRLNVAFHVRRVIDKKGVEWLLEQMSPAQRREMKERLKA